MTSAWAVRGACLLALVVAGARGQYDDFDIEEMMAGYGDMFGGGGYGGMGDMMPGLAGMMGGMGGMGGMGYGGYGYGDTAPAHTDLVDLADVEKFMSDDPESPSVIGFYNEDTQSDEIMVFRTTAARMSDMGVRFGLATEDDVLESLKYTSGRVMAYPAKRFVVEGVDRVKHRYPGGTLDAEPLQNWINKVTTPVGGLLTWENGARYQEIGLPEVMAFTSVDLENNGKEFDDVAGVLRKVASSRPKGEVSYMVADPETMQPLFSRCNFPDGSKDKVVVGIRMDNMFYRMDDNFSEEAVAKFVQQYMAGSLQAVHVEEMDEPMGASDDEPEDSSVVVLTPDNFEEVVNDESKDVMIEFYAPWCGHCQQLQPVYAELADVMSSKPSVVIAKMDADAHTPPEIFGVQSYPTIVFLKAGHKDTPMPYGGPRTMEAMLEYIELHATTVPPTIASAA